jgi:hypothetical protein
MGNCFKLFRKQRKSIDEPILTINEIYKDQSLLTSFNDILYEDEFKSLNTRIWRDYYTFMGGKTNKNVLENI